MIFYYKVNTIKRIILFLEPARLTWLLKWILTHWGRGLTHKSLPSARGFLYDLVISVFTEDEDYGYANVCSNLQPICRYSAVKISLLVTDPKFVCASFWVTPSWCDQDLHLNIWLGSFKTASPSSLCRSSCFFFWNEQPHQGKNRIKDLSAHILLPMLKSSFSLLNHSFALLRQLKER